MALLLGLLMILGLIWFLISLFIAVVISDEDSIPSEKKGAWIFFWPILVGSHFQRFVRNSYKEMIRQARELL